jgi:hypothetical protein
MSLEQELARFDQLLATQFPELLRSTNAGLNDAAVQRFREALAPMGLTEELETLYRWHDGGDAALFGGWRLRTYDEVVRQRTMNLEISQHPPAWLSIFEPDEQTFGVVTLEVPGSGTVPGVWFGMYQYGGLDRLFVSIESLVATCADAIDRGLLQVYNKTGPLPISLAMSERGSLDHPEFTPLRVEREPVTWLYPDPPEGTVFSSFPEPDWPAPWLASLGLDATPPALEGATLTISQLVELSDHGDASGTIVGKVVRFGAWAKEWSATVDDGTGTLSLVGPNQALFGATMGDTAEFDVQIDAAERRASPDYADQYGHLRPMIRGLIPGVPARATAVRLMTG